MDNFNVLSDELLIKILSFVPTKDAVSTSILSKRWKYLWMWLPKLKFGRRYAPSSECERLKCFLDRNLPLHRAPVIESLHLELSSSHFTPDCSKLWIVTAIFHCLRELEVYCGSYAPKPAILPRDLFTCKSLAILKLHGDIHLDVPPMVFLPSLKTLHLKRTRYFNEESLRRLLSNCPMLEDLLVEIQKNEFMAHENEIMGELTVVAPSLQRLSLHIPYNYDIGGIVIKTPSLKYFKFEDCNRTNHYYLIESMPNLIEAYVEVDVPNIKSLIGSLTSVKHLEIFSEVTYVEDFVFNQLHYLKIRRGYDHPSDLLVRLLNGSPNLQVLHIDRRNDPSSDEVFDWKQPSSVPECMLSSLQTFNWDGYTGTPEERDFAVYTLKNASHLKTARIKYEESEVPKFEMIKELTLTSRASTSCQLVFD